MPPVKILELLIANGAFLINLAHQLRAEISPILVSIFHKVSTCHAFTSQILELLNSFLKINLLTFEFFLTRGS